MSPPDEPLLDRVRAEGAATEVDESGGPMGGVAENTAAMVAAVRSAVAAPDADAALAAWDSAGSCESPECLDAGLPQVLSGTGMPLFGGGRRRRLRDGARFALHATRIAGTARLAGAVLGAVGERADVAALETLAVHPALTLHMVTALANLRHADGRAALLRLLSRTAGPARAIVIDRLLAFAEEPSVRLALVRDAFRGLDEGLCRELAPAIADRVDLVSLCDDERAPAELRERARSLLELVAGSRAEPAWDADDGAPDPTP